MRLRTVVPIGIAAGFGSLLAGCCCGLKPNWSEPPGTINYQRSAAVIHDPFPDNAIGPPVVGGRPLGYQFPPSEAVKAQESSPRRGGY